MITLPDIWRGALILAILLLLILSQRYWFRKLWQLKSRVRHAGLRRALRSVWFLLLVGVIISFFGWRMGFLPRTSAVIPLVAVWLLSSMLAYVCIRIVLGIEWVSRRVHGRFVHRGDQAHSCVPVQPSSHAPAPADLHDPSRRYFFQTAARFAGAVPFVGALYGFAAERLHFEIERAEIPIPNLPAALDGLRIAQLSDFHAGPFMPVEQIRRAVKMANELGAELAVVTGDFITSGSDPLEACIEELAALRVCPGGLGVWACLGNHEIYAQCEDRAAYLLGKAGIRILRRESSELMWRGQAFNLIGVDYQRTRTPSGKRLAMLGGVEELVRRDVPNILLSHNPQVFPRAAELGIELTLAGHTHGGQISVEILERNLSPARFATPFIAGLYRKNGASGEGQVASEGRDARFSLATSHPPPASASLYVNRGLGTVGAPVRLGAPPEITLLTLRRA